MRSVNHSEAHEDINPGDAVYLTSPGYWREAEVLGPWKVDKKSPTGRIRLVGRGYYSDAVHYKSKLEALLECQRIGERRLSVAQSQVAAAQAFLSNVRNQIETEE